MTAAPSSWITIRLIAAREIRERSRTKGFRISAAVILFSAVALAVLPSLLNTSTTERVGVVGDIPPGFGQILDRSPALAEGDRVEVTSFPDAAAADAALRADVVGVVFDPAANQLVWTRIPSQSLDAIVTPAVQQLRSATAAATLDLDATQLQPVLSPTPPEIRSLESVDPELGTRYGVAAAGTILLFVALQIFGGFVLSGVVEEKTTRIVEVLLAHARPDQILAGKVLGIGSLAVAEMAVIIAAAVGAGQIADTIPLPTVGLGAALSVLGWFILGFFFYAIVFAAAGALVNRQDDAQSVTLPVLLPLIAGYIYVISTISIPENIGTTVLSFIPLTAPVAMPTRIQLGVAPPWQVAISVALMVVTGMVVLKVAAKIYSGGLLRTGTRVTVREALASAGDISG